MCVARTSHVHFNSREAQIDMTAAIGKIFGSPVMIIVSARAIVTYLVCLLIK
jgi:hypothetical protein